MALPTDLSKTLSPSPQRLKLQDVIRVAIAPFGQTMVSAVLEAERLPGGLHRLCRALGLRSVDDPVALVNMLGAALAKMDVEDCLVRLRRAMPEVFLQDSMTVGPEGITLRLDEHSVPPAVEGYRPTVASAQLEAIRPRYPDVNPHDDTRTMSATAMRAKLAGTGKRQHAIMTTIPPSQPPTPAANATTTPAIASGGSTAGAQTWPFVERRSGLERRSGKDRRSQVDVVFKNKRFGGERRSGKERRVNPPFVPKNKTAWRPTK